MRRSAPATALLFLAACLDAPSYEGRACDPSGACPEDLVCVVGFCRAPGTIADDASTPAPTDAAADDAAVIVEVDGGAADASPALDAAVDPCDAAPNAPTSGWEARHFTLDAQDRLATCVAVEPLAGAILERDWGTTGPSATLTDRFGSRYTARRTLEAGVYTLRLQHDDGLRVSIDGALVYDAWTVGDHDTTVATPYLRAGEHALLVEHYDQAGAARLRVELERGCPLSAPTIGWSIGYFARNAQGEAERAHCLGTESRAADVLTGVWTTPPLAVRDAAVTSWVMVARGQRTMRGRELFSMTHGGEARLRVGTVDVLDAWSIGVPEHVLLTYARGPQILQLEVGDLRGAGNYVLVRQNVCDAMQARAVSSAEWAAAYYRVTVGGGTWTLDLDDCLGAELYGTEWLDLTGEWQTGGPPSLVSLGVTDLFGAVFRTSRNSPAARDVRVTHDDGLRVNVNGTRIYDSWTAPQVINTTIALPQGAYALTLEYFENLGGAGIRFVYP